MIEVDILTENNQESIKNNNIKITAKIYHFILSKHIQNMLILK